MKRFLLICFSVLAAHTAIYAQCASCTPIDCSVQKPTGGLCDTLPDGTAGVPYDTVISFYMPNTLTDPTTLGQCGGCSSVTLRQIDIVGVQGLPPGLTWTASDNGSYDVDGGTNFGCVRFCGTPVAPGTYYIVVNLLADVTANGVPVIGSVNADNQSQQYRDTLVIFPGVSDCPGTFVLGAGPCVTTACNSISVDLDANLTNTSCANLISYDWDYGNGQTSNVKTPGIINYTTPDTFPITLTTTFYTYVIDKINIIVSGGFGGDIEESFGGSPEPYIRIDALSFNNRGGASGANQTFSNLALVIPDANCDDPVEIRVREEDTGLPEGTNPLGSGDDNIDVYNIVPPVTSTYPYIVSGDGANSDIYVTFDTVATSSVTETINIIVNPMPPVPTLVLADDSICNGDSTLLSTAEGLGEGFQFNWYLNDTTELPTGDSAVYVSRAGAYTLKITNSTTGCNMFSTAAVSLAIGTPAPGNVNILNNGTQLFLSPFPTGFSAEWYYNGNLVTGQNGKFLPILGNGTYTATVYNTLFPDCSVEANAYELTGVGIADVVTNNLYDVNVYPNPNSGRFNINFGIETTADVKITVSNLIGQQVFNRTLEGFSGTYNQELDLSGLGKGVYIVNFETGGTAVNRKVVVQ